MVCWALLARTRVVGWLVGALLLVGASVVLAVLKTQALRPSQVYQVLVAFLLGPAAVVVAGRLAERRIAGTLDGGRRRVGRILFGCYVGVAALCAAGIAFLAFADEAPYVDETEVLPLPAGLRLVEKGEVRCGSGTCGMNFVIGGEPGMPVGEVERRVRELLVQSRGWRLGAAGTACRQEPPNGDFQSSDIEVTVQGEQVVVVLESGRGYGYEACPGP
jgi:hypothetical protein